MTEIALLGKKIGMTREFYKSGQVVPVTVIKMEKARIIQIIEDNYQRYGYQEISQPSLEISSQIGSYLSEDQSNQMSDVFLFENEKEELLRYYINMTNENYEMVLREINFFSLQRNLKILGIFNRLSIRDGKVKYLGYLPATFNFIKSNLLNLLKKIGLDFLWIQKQMILSVQVPLRLVMEL